MHVTAVGGSDRGRRGRRRRRWRSRTTRPRRTRTRARRARPRTTRIGTTAPGSTPTRPIAGAGRRLPSCRSRESSSARPPGSVGRRFCAVTGTVTAAVVPCVVLGAVAVSVTETQCCGVAASAWTRDGPGDVATAAPVPAAVGYTGHGQLPAEGARHGRRAQGVDPAPVRPRGAVSVMTPGPGLAGVHRASVERLARHPEVAGADRADPRRPSATTRRRPSCPPQGGARRPRPRRAGHVGSSVVTGDQGGVDRLSGGRVCLSRIAMPVTARSSDGRPGPPWRPRT